KPLVILHRFTEQGLSAFEKMLQDLRANPRAWVLRELLSDPSMSEPVSGGPVMENRTFESRLEAATYLEGVCETAAIVEPERDAALWAWLTLYYFDTVCPLEPDGTRECKDSARYIPEYDNFRKRYRHLLCGPYRILRAHNDDPSRALVLLCGPVHVPG